MTPPRSQPRCALCWPTRPVARRWGVAGAGRSRRATPGSASPRRWRRCMRGLLPEVTPLILTGDEEANIGRTLGQLRWARAVIVVDSGSIDRTREIAASFPNVRVVTRAIDDLASQWTHAASLASTRWVLTLDADYFVSGSITDEIAALAPPPDVAGYEAEFVYAINGRPLRGSLYTPRAVLLRRGAFSFFMDGHTQRVRVAGRVERLRQPLIHDDRKNLR